METACPREHLGQYVKTQFEIHVRQRQAALRLRNPFADLVSHRETFLLIRFGGRQIAFRERQQPQSPKRVANASLVPQLAVEGHRFLQYFLRAEQVALVEGKLGLALVWFQFGCDLKHGFDSLRAFCRQEIVSTVPLFLHHLSAGRS